MIEDLQWKKDIDNEISKKNNQNNFNTYNSTNSIV